MYPQLHASHMARRQDDAIEQRLAQVERGARAARLELAALSQRQKKADERNQELGHKMDQLEEHVDSLEAHAATDSEVRARAQVLQSALMAQKAVHAF